MKAIVLIEYYMVLIILILFSSGCDKQVSNQEEKIPLLTTDIVTDITYYTATCGGVIINDMGSTVKSRGVCWSVNPDPTISDSKTDDGAGAGSFRSMITGLLSDCTYFVRAYATNSYGTGYGNTFRFTTLGKVIDIDGNIYNTVMIGTQIWMVENLRVTRYRNGDPVDNYEDNKVYKDLTTGAVHFYYNDTNIMNQYGSLYNWYAVNDVRNLAPHGWHIPSYNEWIALIDTLGGEEFAGGRLKATGVMHWWKPNTGASNLSGFTALPGGQLDAQQSKDKDIGQIGFWWSSTDHDHYVARYFYISSQSQKIYKLLEIKQSCFSVRCIKD